MIFTRSPEETVGSVALVLMLFFASFVKNDLLSPLLHCVCSEILACHVSSASQPASRALQNPHTSERSYALIKTLPVIKGRNWFISPARLHFTAWRSCWLDSRWNPTLLVNLNPRSPPPPPTSTNTHTPKGPLDVDQENDTPIGASSS